MDLSGFDCGNPDFNDYIQNDSIQDYKDRLSVTYIGMIDGMPAAYVCLVAAAYQAEAVNTPSDRA